MEPAPGHGARARRSPDAHAAGRAGWGRLRRQRSRPGCGHRGAGGVHGPAHRTGGGARPGPGGGTAVLRRDDHRDGGPRGTGSGAFGRHPGGGLAIEKETISTPRPSPRTWSPCPGPERCSPSRWPGWLRKGAGSSSPGTHRLSSVRRSPGPDWTSPSAGPQARRTPPFWRPSPPAAGVRATGRRPRRLFI